MLRSLADGKWSIKHLSPSLTGREIGSIFELLTLKQQEPQNLSRQQVTGTVMGDSCQETFLLPKG